MVWIETLNELSQLKNSGFGQPRPRHGLDLLYWFAHDYVMINQYGLIVPKFSPENKDFGFHRFYNRIEDDNDHTILPNQNQLYYEVGNLNAPKADKLPRYVKENNTRQHDGSNKDRIIVRLVDGHFDRVYVTEHSDTIRFSQTGTFRISQGLIRIIQNMSRENFLQAVQARNYVPQNYQPKNDLPRNNVPANDSWCTIL